MKDDANLVETMKDGIQMSVYAKLDITKYKENAGLAIPIPRLMGLIVSATLDFLEIEIIVRNAIHLVGDVPERSTTNVRNVLMSHMNCLMENAKDQTLVPKDCSKIIKIMNVVLVQLTVKLVKVNNIAIIVFQVLKKSKK